MAGIWPGISHGVRMCGRRSPKPLIETVKTRDLQAAMSDTAAKFAKQAVAAAGAKQSAFASHRTLVERNQKALVARLERLARRRTGDHRAPSIRTQ